mgnify:CR=1 FL=1
MKVGIVKDRIYLEHVTDRFHPENAQRLEHIYEMVERLPQDDLVYVAPRPASEDEICLIHSPRYYEFVAATAGKTHTQLDPDTSTSPRSFEAATMAVGGLLNLVDAVMKGEVDNGFALIRPPGHHAEKDRAMGFCLFNNVAIAAAYALGQHRLKRVLIIDWDLHHGNGTQHSFYERADVLYFSSHQYPYYPGTGFFGEVGNGAGKGFTVNVPLGAGPGDAEFFLIFEEILEPIALEFKPELIFVSAGFDIYYRDPLGGMQVTPQGFANLTRVILEFAQKTCGGKTVFVLEGGYHLEGLRDSARQVLKTLRGELLSQGRDETARTKADRRMIDPVLKKVREVQKPYWKM